MLIDVMRPQRRENRGIWEYALQKDPLVWHWGNLVRKLWPQQRVNPKSGVWFDWPATDGLILDSYYDGVLRVSWLLGSHDYECHSVQVWSTLKSRWLCHVEDPEERRIWTTFQDTLDSVLAEPPIFRPLDAIAQEQFDWSRLSTPEKRVHESLQMMGESVDALSDD